MKAQEYTPVQDCLALTVRKEHSLIVIKKASRKIVSMSKKTLLYVLFLMFANILV